VKLITNDASKNAENKEIVRLKGVSSYNPEKRKAAQRYSGQNLRFY
jgi:hypothetical protein